MFIRILLFGLVALVLPAVAFGANHAYNEECMTRPAIIAMFAEFDRDIADDLKHEERISFSHTESAKIIASMMKENPFIEVDCEIDKSWFERAEKMLLYMGECKRFMVSFIHRDEIPKSQEYQKVKHNLEEVSKRFSELVKNPTPVEQRKLNKLREEKLKWVTQKHHENAKKSGINSPE